MHSIGFGFDSADRLDSRGIGGVARLRLVLVSYPRVLGNWLLSGSGTAAILVFLTTPLLKPKT